MIADRKIINTARHSLALLGGVIAVAGPLCTVVLLFGGLPGRMSRLETKAETIDTRLQTAIEQLATIRGKLEYQPAGWHPRADLQFEPFPGAASAADPRVSPGANRAAAWPALSEQNAQDGRNAGG